MLEDTRGFPRPSGVLKNALGNADPEWRPILQRLHEIEKLRAEVRAELWKKEHEAQQKDKTRLDEIEKLRAEASKMKQEAQQKDKAKDSQDIQKRFRITAKQVHDARAVAADAEGELNRTDGQD